MTELVNVNKSLKGELLDTTNQLKALKESFNELEQYSRRDCMEIRGIPEISSDTREDTTKIYERKKNLFHSDIGHHLETMKKRSEKLNNEGLIIERRQIGSLYSESQVICTPFQTAVK